MNNYQFIKDNSNKNKRQDRMFPLSIQQSSLSKLHQIINDKNAYMREKQNRKLEHKMKKMRKKYNSYISEHLISSKKLFASDSIYGLISNITYKNYQLQAFQMIKQISKKGCQKDLIELKHQQSQKGKRTEYKDQQNKWNIKFFCLVLNKTIEINNKKILNTSFSYIKRLNSKLDDMTQFTIESNIQNKIQKGSQQNLKDLRILQYSNRPDVKLNIQQHSIDCEMLQLSIYQSRCQIHTEKNEKGLIYSSKKNLQDEEKQIIQLEKKLQDLEAQMQNKANRYATIKQNLINQIQLNNLKESKKNSQLQKSSISHKSFTYQNGNIQISPDARSAICYDQDIINQSGDIGQFIQKNKELQQETDRIRQTVEQLISFSGTEKFINPDLIAILMEVKQILQPNPLGISLIIG